MAQPTAPVAPAPAKPSKPALPVLYADILKVATEAPPEFHEMIKREVKLKVRLADARDTYQENLPHLGKLLCVSKIQFEENKKAGRLPSAMKFAKYFEGLYGEGAMDTRAYSLSNTFDSFVLTGKISEHDYDEGNTVDALQRASRIVTAVGYDLEHAAVAEAAALLKVSDKKKLKKLARIQARIQEVTEGEGEKAVIKIVFISEEELDRQAANPGVTEQQPIADNLAQSPSGLAAMLAAIAAVAQSTNDAGTAQILAQFHERLDTATTANVITAPDGRQSPRWSEEQLMAWNNAKGAIQNKTEEQTRFEYELAVEMVAKTNELLKGARIKKSDWLTGKASLIGAPAAETPAGVLKAA